MMAKHLNSKIEQPVVQIENVRIRNNVYNIIVNNERPTKFYINTFCSSREGLRIVE